MMRYITLMIVYVVVTSSTIGYGDIAPGINTSYEMRRKSVIVLKPNSKSKLMAYPLGVYKEFNVCFP